MIYWISVLLVIVLAAMSFHLGSIYAAKVVSRKWTTYIMEKCVRLDLLNSRIQDEFDRGKAIAAEGMPVVVTQDVLIRIIKDVVEKQNR